MCFCKQKPPWQGGAAPVASPGKRRFSVDKRLSALCLSRPRGQTGNVAIYSLHLRSIDKITAALPRELDARQRRMLVAVFAERVTQGRASWLAAIHQSGAGAHNPHAHIVIRDRDPETGKRVALLSEKGACRNIRLLWEQAVNGALEAQGSPQRVTRLSHAARGIETPPQRQG